MFVCKLIVTSDVVCNVYGLFGQDKQYISVIKVGVSGTLADTGSCANTKYLSM